MSSTGLSFAAGGAKAAAMDQKPPPLSREERLAAKLRENLKRRKAQARVLDGKDNAPLSKGPPKS